MFVNRISALGTSTCTKPAYLFSIICLTITLIFTSLILAGCTSESAILRNFHLLELRYAESSSLPAAFNLTSDSGINGTFSTLRVGYRKICIEAHAGNTTEGDADWSCYGDDEVKAMDFGRDPLDLLSVAMIYKSKISYSLPHFAAITFTAIAFLALIPNLIPVIPVPPVTRRVAAVSGLVAAMLSGGAMTLQQVTSGAVANLVTQVSTGGIEVDMGNSAVGFGWAAFALTAVAAVAIAAVVAAEIAREKAEQKAREYVNKGVEKASGGRVDLEDLGAFGGWNSKKAAGADTTERKPSGESGYAGSGYASYAAGFGRSMNEGHPAFGRGPGGSSNASGIPRPSSAAVALATKLFQKR